MTKEREMGLRAQTGVEGSSKTKIKGKSGDEKVSTSGDIDSSETISNSGLSGSAKGRGAQRVNGSPEPGQGKRQLGGKISKFGHKEESSRSLNGHQQSVQQSNRPKCRCWCCCCSCSCLNPKNNENGAVETPTDPVCDGELLPSLEEIRGWMESFDKLMRSPGGRKVFRDFLKCEYSEENILFWLACEELKKESRAEAVEEKARLIYEDYISILSPKEVSLDSRVREIVNQNMVDPTPHTFDEAQMQIYTLMHRDSYPRFVNSSMYKKLAQLNTVHSTQTASSPTANPSHGSSVSNTASRKQSITTT